jgi:SAM-dependent methyltransferase
MFSVSARRRIVRYTRWPPVGGVRFGSLKRLKPISRDWGFERGLPIDRYYIEKFLSDCNNDIGGRVLEIKENIYTLKFGGDRVSKSDVLHKVEGNPMATIVADLTSAEELVDNIFDCIICTQTLQCIYAIKSAIETLYRIIRPGGVLLVTVPSITHISRYDMDHWGDYWRFTSLSTKLLFEEAFPEDKLTVRTYGNVLTAVAFLHGVASEELSKEELDYIDNDYELLIAVRAVKPNKRA